MQEKNPQRTRSAHSRAETARLARQASRGLARLAHARKAGAMRHRAVRRERRPTTRELLDEADPE